MTIKTRDSHDGEAGPTVAAVFNQLVLKEFGRYVLVIDAGSGNGSFLNGRMKATKGMEIINDNDCTWSDMKIMKLL